MANAYLSLALAALGAVSVHLPPRRAVAPRCPGVHCAAAFSNKHPHGAPHPFLGGQHQQQPQQRQQQQQQPVHVGEDTAAQADSIRRQRRRRSQMVRSQAEGALEAAPEQLFRHRFLVSKDLLIRVPLEGPTLLRTFVTYEQLCGVLQVTLEAHRPRHTMRWSNDAQRMLQLPNAGGSSLLSEVLSFELLSRAFGATLDRTEMELKYTPGSKITDYAVTVCGGYQLGVSVTRAFKWEQGLPDCELTEHDAYRLLSKKLAAINISSRNVRNYAWHKQVLHVWARTYRDAQLLERQYLSLDPKLRTNTIVLITLCHGVDWIW